MSADQLFDKFLKEGGRGSCNRAISSDSRSGSDVGASGSSNLVKDVLDKFLKICQDILPNSEFPPVFKKLSKNMSCHRN